MHSYLKSIGFSGIKTESELNKLLTEVRSDYQQRQIAKAGEQVFVEMSKDFLPGSGITVCGVVENERFHLKQYFPYFRGNTVSTTEPVTIEIRADGDTFAGVCDDDRIGVSLIFFVQNPAVYFKESEIDLLKIQKTGTIFTCLAESGTILFPVQKNEEIELQRKKEVKQHNGLLNAARNGDQEAIESLTVEEMDLYTMLSRRVTTEDVLSIVETSFMPYGIECDRYQIIGTIQFFTKVQNPYSKEYVYQMTFECNDINFEVTINEKDLLGLPEIGRRFKGIVWLQGLVKALS